MRDKLIPSAELERLYTYYNRRFFGNRLPKRIVLAWGEPGKRGFRRCDLGHTYVSPWAERRDRKGRLLWREKNVYVVEISPLFKTKRQTITRGTLLHEMVHVALPMRVVHGPKFQAEMLRLAKAGAFKGIW